MNGTLEEYREREEVWRIGGVLWPYIWLRGTNFLLVTLTTLLRVLMVKHPLSYQHVHIATSRICCIVAWVGPLLISSIYFVVSLPGLYDLNTYIIFVGIGTHGIGTVPFLLTVLLYAILLCSLNPEENQLVKSFARMTHGIVTGLIVCNVPGLIIMGYLSSRLVNGRSEHLFESTTVV